MKILIVGILNQNKHFLRIKEEGEKRGHVIEGCFVSDLIVAFNDKRTDIYLKSKRRLSDFDIIYLWTLGKRRWEWQVAAKIVAKTNPNIRFINSSFVNFSDLSFTPCAIYPIQVQAENSLLYPRTALFYNTKALPDFLADFEYPVIVKFANSSQGRGVFKADSKEELLSLVGDMQKTKEPILLRQFIPNDGDFRIITLGYKAIGAMKRIPVPGNYKANISQGATAKAVDLGKCHEIVEIAERLSKLTKIEIAGVDIVLDKETGKPYILEINPGPQFLGMEKYTGFNIARAIINYFEQLEKDKSLQS